MVRSPSAGEEREPARKWRPVPLQLSSTQAHSAAFSFLTSLALTTGLTSTQITKHKPCFQAPAAAVQVREYALSTSCVCQASRRLAAFRVRSMSLFGFPHRKSPEDWEKQRWKPVSRHFLGWGRKVLGSARPSVGGTLGRLRTLGNGGAGRRGSRLGEVVEWLSLRVHWAPGVT